MKSYPQSTEKSFVLHVTSFDGWCYSEEYHTVTCVSEVRHTPFFSKERAKKPYSKWPVCL